MRTPLPSTAFGYSVAVVAAAISGVSVYVNGLGVRTFSDPLLYTCLKDGLVGIALLIPLAFAPGLRAEYGHIPARTWIWLVALALTGGSVPFALFFSGLQITTPATGALINHFQFVLVALFAMVFLRERVRPAVWAGFLVLLVGTVLGTNLHALQWNEGALLIAASTVLFAIDFVIAKHLLTGLSTLMVLTARMTFGTAMLSAYALAVGRLTPPTQLNAEQWRFLLVTGVLLLLFTATTFTAIRNASVSAVLAIGAASPIITTVLQVGGNGGIQLAPADVAGLALTVMAVVTIVVVGLRQDSYEMSDRLVGNSQVVAGEPFQTR